MAKTQEMWSAELAGPPVAVARHVEVPIKLFEHPDRVVKLIIPLSRGERFIRAFTRALSIGRERGPQVDSPESDLGDGS